MSVDLRTEFCGVTLAQPVIVASGTFGFGTEYAEYVDFGYARRDLRRA